MLNEFTEYSIAIKEHGVINDRLARDIYMVGEYPVLYSAPNILYNKRVEKIVPHVLAWTIAAEIYCEDGTYALVTGITDLVK